MKKVVAYTIILLSLSSCMLFCAQGKVPLPICRMTNATRMQFRESLKLAAPIPHIHRISARPREAAKKIIGLIENIEDSFYSAEEHGVPACRMTKENRRRFREIYKQLDIIQRNPESGWWAIEAAKTIRKLIEEIEARFEG